MNEKTNIGQAAAPCVDARLISVYELLGRKTLENKDLTREKAEIYAALQQSELEATKWRCETEALRKAYAQQCEESAGYERRMNCETRRADTNFERACTIERELKKTEQKLAGVEKDRDVFRDEILNNMPALEKAAQVRAELEETKRKLADAEKACVIYQEYMLNNPTVAGARQLQEKANCLDSVKRYITSVYADL
jgi:chromosome segregation ATPase